MNKGSILNSVFENTQNSYKFFWWLAIMELVLEKDRDQISFDDIVIKIITKMWYPINYFKLSFGKQDKIEAYINNLKDEFQLDDNITEVKLEYILRNQVDHKTITRISQKITKYVPYRFIRPWFSEQTRGLEDQLINDVIIDLQKTKKKEIPYTINSHERTIYLSPQIKKFIKINYIILESFTLFKLTSFLEKRNPDVPNITVKLFKPVSRSLNKVNKLWEKFIDLNPDCRDVFEKNKLKNINHFSIDHFLPWSYVSHDQIWNTHPISQSVNSSKNNTLPSLKYLEDFTHLQFSLLQLILSINDKNFIHEYISFLKVSQNELAVMELKEFVKLFRESLIKHFETARNMGFDKNWQISLKI